jgi:hypothetical protein
VIHYIPWLICSDKAATQKNKVQLFSNFKATLFNDMFDPRKIEEATAFMLLQCRKLQMHYYFYNVVYQWLENSANNSST